MAPKKADLSGTQREAWAIRPAYAPCRQNFSETVLEAALPFLAVSTLPPLTWSDLGTPQRVFKLFRTLRVSPTWMGGRRPDLGAAQRVG